MTLFNVISKQLKEVNNIQLNKFDYDVIYVNQSINESDLNKASNGAITLSKDIIKLFPRLMKNGSTEEFIMKAPIKFNKLNLEYIGVNSEEIGIDLEIPIMFSLQKNEFDEIELGGKLYSDQVVSELTELLKVKDMFIILKLKNKLSYEMYIIREKNKIKEFFKELEEQQMEEVIETTITFMNTEKEVITNRDSSKENKELFIHWYFPNSEYKASEGTKGKYLNVLKRFEKVVNEKEIELLDFWSNPIKFEKKFSFEKILKIAGNLENSAFNRKDGRGGSELSAILKPYYEWVKILDENKEDKYNIILEEENRQLIYFGAPGTGKSYQLKKDSELFPQSNVERVTFHPNMSYGQFIGAFKPFPYREQTTNESKITYKFVPGVLMKQLLKALSSPNEAFLLIIEEINRANVSAVFGDFFQLLDRDETNCSEYPITISEDIKFYLEEEVYKNSATYNVENIRKAIQNGLILPSNLFLWSTMNSSDQGVLPMDTAFKRRWEQKYFGINQAYENNKDEFESYSKVICGERKVQWNLIREFLNKQLIKVNVPEDKLMGPYFISKNILTSSDEKLTNSFKNKVLMYLFEDASKQYRRNLFNLSPDKMIYSEVIKAFDEIGLELFKESDHLISGLIENDSTSTNDESL